MYEAFAFIVVGLITVAFLTLILIPFVIGGFFIAVEIGNEIERYQMRR